MKLVRIPWKMIVVSLTAVALAGCGSVAPPGTPAAEPPAHSVSGVTATAAVTPSLTSLPTHAEVETQQVGTSPATPTPTPLPPTPTATTRPTQTSPAASATPEPTPVPPASPQNPTASPPASATPLSPSSPTILSFTAVPTTTHTIGDPIVLTWAASGDRVEICPIAGNGPVEIQCQEVPPTGETTFVTDEKSMGYLGFGLRAKSGASTTWSVAYLHLQCKDLREWFFDNPPQRCPAEPALYSYAAGQYFEHGFMVWVEATDDFFIFSKRVDEHGFQTFQWTIGLQRKPGASPDNRVGEEPPSGLYEPISGFGMIWRGEAEGLRDDMRQRLGWATEPEFGFDTAFQCETPAHPRSWSCYLRGPRGELLYLRPDSTAQVRFLWEEK